MSDQFKSIAIHLMLSWRRLNMIETQRILMPPGDFPTVPEASSVLGVFRAGVGIEEEGPDYIRFDVVIRLLGRCKEVYLTPTLLEMLHLYFLEEDPGYGMAHQKLLGM